MSPPWEEDTPSPYAVSYVPNHFKRVAILLPPPTPMRNPPPPKIPKHNRFSGNNQIFQEKQMNKAEMVPYAYELSCNMRERAKWASALRNIMYFNFSGMYDYHK